jgi:hypothetical protein
MSNVNSAKQWYDNKALVCLLCIFIFPVGLYALWKSNTIHKFWKISVSIIFIAFIVIALLDDFDEKSNYTIKEDYEVTETVKVNSEQLEFINKKVEQFKELIESKASSNKISEETKLLTNSLLKNSKYIINEWEGAIISLDMFKDENLDISISILSKLVIGNRKVSKDNKDYMFESSISIEATQGDSKKYGTKGIPRNGEIYEKIKTLKEGDIVIFSAKVLNSHDITEKTGINLSTLLDIELLDIRKK